MSVERAKPIDLGRRKAGSDFWFVFGVSGECPLAFPGFHRRALHGFVSALAFRACSCESEQNRLAEIEALRQSEVLCHALWIDLQLFDNVTQFHEHVVEQDG